jgi:hypothetical protein
MVVLSAKPVDAELVAQVDGLTVRRDGTVSGACMFVVRGRCFASVRSPFSCEECRNALGEGNLLIFSPLATDAGRGCDVEGVWKPVGRSGDGFV